MLVILLILVLLAIVLLLTPFFKKGGVVKGLLFFAPGVGETSSAPFVGPPPEDHYKGDTAVSSAQNRVDDLAMELDDQEWMLNKKKGEVEQLKKGGQLGGENSAKLSSLQDTIDTLELRLVSLKKDLMAARQTAIALDELEISFRMLQHELAQSQQGLHHSLGQINRLQQQLDESRDYAAHLKEQQSLLQKKLSVYEELNRDQQAADDACRT